MIVCSGSVTQKVVKARIRVTAPHMHLQKLDTSAKIFEVGEGSMGSNECRLMNVGCKAGSFPYFQFLKVLVSVTS